MQMVRDLIRDLVGILFPGGLLVIFTLWFLWAAIIPFSPSTSMSFLTTDNNIFVVLIFSYIAGQALRMKRLEDLEEKCTAAYRKKSFPNLDRSEWEKTVANIDKEEENYFAGQANIERLKKVYEEYSNRFRFWEEFPYAYRLRARRLLSQSENYIKFFEKYDRQGITKTENFFNFCKSVIYEYSPSFKEEVLRQESLVRLFAGIYYVITYGKVIAALILVLHAVLLIGHYLKADFLNYTNVELSWKLFGAALLAFSLFIYMNKEILQRLRYMRVKELNLAYDGFYLVCTNHNHKLDL